MCSWDTRQMFFGAGTELFVEPENQPTVSPSVFVMRNGTKVACLAKDFYPKEVTVTLESPTNVKQFDTSIVLTPSGKYSAVKVGQSDDANSVTCSVTHDKKTVQSSDFETKTDSSDTIKPTESKDTKQTPASENTQKTSESENNPRTSENQNKPKATVHPEKVNMMSLTVLGLRMLFAKSVAINVVLTAKLFFF